MIFLWASLQPDIKRVISSFDYDMYSSIAFRNSLYELFLVSYIVHFLFYIESSIKSTKKCENDGRFVTSVY